MQKNILMVMVLVLAASMAGQAQVFSSADFSKDAGYADGSVLGQPTNAASQWTDANPGVPSVNFLVEDGKLSIIGDGTGGRWVYLPIPVQQGVFNFSFEGVYVGDGTMTNIGVCLSDTENFNLDGNAVPTYNEQGGMIRFADNGLIDVRNGDGVGGGSFTKLADVPYNDGEVFYVRAVVDAYLWNITVFVRKQGQTEETMIAEEYGFRRNNSPVTEGVNALVIFDNNSDRSLPGIGLILDNFVLFGSTPVNEWSLF